MTATELLAPCRLCGSPRGVQCASGYAHLERTVDAERVLAGRRP